MTTDFDDVVKNKMLTEESLHIQKSQYSLLHFA